jgi:long-chain fatty acid transport protein
MNRKMGVMLLALTMLVSVAGATDGTRMIGFNAKTVGRGGASIGVFDNPTLMMTNPAGISFLAHNALDVNLSLMVPAVHFQNGLNDADGETNYFPLPDVAYVYKPSQGPWTWGLGLFTQGGMGADFTLKHNLFRDQTGGFVLQDYHSKFAIMQGGPSVAYAGSKFSVGVSAHVVYGQLEFSMPYSLSPAVMKGVVNPTNGMTFGDMFSAPPAMGGFGYTEVTAAAKMTGLSALGFQGKIGLAYRVNDQFELGFSYSSPVNLTFKNGTADMDMTAQFNDAFGKAVQGYMAQNPSASMQQAQGAVMQQFTQMGINMSAGVTATYDLETKLALPSTIGVGASYKASKQVCLALDVEWLNWSSAFDKMSLSLTNGNSANINRMMGNSGSFDVDFPMDWKNSLSVRIGGEYAFSDAITGRIGYAYGANPVPSENLFPVFPAIVENHLMIGGSAKLSKAMSLHLAYEKALQNSQTASSVSKIAGEYNGSTCELGENIIHISLSVGL